MAPFPRAAVAEIDHNKAGPRKWGGGFVVTSHRGIRGKDKERERLTEYVLVFELWADHGLSSNV